MVSDHATFYLWDVDYMHPAKGRGRTILSVITKAMSIPAAIDQARWIVQTVPDAAGRTYPLPSWEIQAVRFTGTVRYFPEP